MNFADVVFGPGRLSIERTPCRRLLCTATSPVSKARGALGAAVGGLARWALGAGGGALGAVGASAGASGFCSSTGFTVGCGAVFEGGACALFSGLALEICDDVAVGADEGANDRVKAGTGGACVGGEESLEPYRFAVVSARPLR